MEHLGNTFFVNSNKLSVPVAFTLKSKKGNFFHNHEKVEPHNELL